MLVCFIVSLIAFAYAIYLGCKNDNDWKFFGFIAMYDLMFVALGVMASIE